MMQFCLLYLVFILTQNTDIIFSAWCLTYCCRFDFIIFRYLPVLFQFYKSCFWQLNITVFNFYRTFLIISCITFSVFMSAFEFRKSTFRIGKKVDKCFLQVLLCIAKSKAVHFFQPFKFSFVLCRRIVQFLFVLFIIRNFI